MFETTTQFCFKDLVHHPIETNHLQNACEPASFGSYFPKYQLLVYIPSPSQPVQSKLHTPSNVVGKVGAVPTVAKEPGKNVPQDSIPMGKSAYIYRTINFTIKLQRNPCLGKDIYIYELRTKFGTWRRDILK